MSVQKFFAHILSKAPQVLMCLFAFLIIGSSYVLAQTATPIPKKVGIDNTEKIPTEVKTQIEALTKYTKEGTISHQSFTSSTLRSVGGEMFLALTGGGMTTDGLTFIGPPPDGVEIAYASPGVIGSISSLTSTIAVLPINTRDYVDYVAQTISNPLGAQPVYAQGLGFSSLRPVLGLWRIFRNVSYFFFVIIFIVIGFLIMFRSKIGGQAAVTVQQALPKIIIALLLVTFSYAIAGLMVDLMYLLIYLMIGLFTVSGPSELSAASLTSSAFSNSFFKNMLDIMGGGVIGSIGGHIGSLVGSLLLDSGWDDALASFGGFSANLVVSLVLLVALIVNLFKVFFALLKAYVGFVFSVVFAPIQLLMGAIPGQNTFGAWLKGLWENLLVFPVVIFFIFCATYFAKAPDAFGDQAKGGFAAPQLGLHAGVAGETVRAFLLFGILAMIPQAVEIAKQLASGKLNIDPGKAMGDFYKQGKLGQSVGLGLLGGAAGLGLGTAGGALYGAYRANKEKDPTKKGQAFRRGLLTGTLAGGGLGAALPTVAPTAVRLAKKGISDAAGGYMQAAFTGTLEAREARHKAEEEKKRSEEGSYEGNVPS